jgi:hypothetical protein
MEKHGNIIFPKKKGKIVPMGIHKHVACGFVLDSLIKECAGLMGITMGTPKD